MKVGILVLLSLLELSCSSPYSRSGVSQPIEQKTSANEAVGTNVSSADQYEGLDVKTDVMDGQKKYSLRFGSAGHMFLPALFARCSNSRNLEVYASLENVVESGSVRLKFDGAIPARQLWTQSTDYQGLFSPVPRSLLGQLQVANVFRLEYTRFHGGPVVAEFNVENARVLVPRLLLACGIIAAERASQNAMAQRKQWKKLATELIEPYIKNCTEEPFHSFGEWCVTGQKSGRPFKEKADALESALWDAEHGIAFCRESAEANKAVGLSVAGPCRE